MSVEKRHRAMIFQIMYAFEPVFKSICCIFSIVCRSSEVFCCCLGFDLTPWTEANFIIERCAFMKLLDHSTLNQRVII